jgi:glyoxylase-like metal-dependent hydrolase (beta-lactamase superfamily II)
MTEIMKTTPVWVLSRDTSPILLCLPFKKQVLIAIIANPGFDRTRRKRWKELMIEEIFHNFYRLEIPLPGNPLKSINSYVIKTSDRNLIIDTGMNRQECMNAMELGLKKLEVDLKKTDFFITHVHSDHLGLAPNLALITSKVYFSEEDAETMRSATLWDDYLNYARLSGFPENELRGMLHHHPGYRYRARGHLDFSLLKSGDTIQIGDYRFECIHTPGHTKGHMCLFDPSSRVLVAGDHILNDITPTIQLWSHDENPLREYLASLEKVFKLNVDRVLPGHRRIFGNCRARIRELKRHHQVRADEIISILEKGRRNAYQLASQMTWDIAYESWDQFPLAQKWFSTGEANAHLRYLEGKGKIRGEMQDQHIITFSLGTN